MLIYTVSAGKLIERVELPLPEDPDQIFKVAPRCVRKKLDMLKLKNTIMGELENFTMPWIRRIFLAGGFRVTACGFDHIECKYHLWIRSKDGSKIHSKQLSKGLHYVRAENGSWMKDSSILDEEELQELQVGRINLIPEIDHILLVNEKEVKLDKIPPYE